MGNLFTKKVSLSLVYTDYRRRYLDETMDGYDGWLLEDDVDDGWMDVPGIAGWRTQKTDFCAARSCWIIGRLV